jgi:hypothetical protein
MYLLDNTKAVLLNMNETLELISDAAEELEEVVSTFDFLILFVTVETIILHGKT